MTEESKLVKEARDLVTRLDGERKSAFCKAVTHKADFFLAQQAISKLCDEIDRLTALNKTQEESIQHLQQQVRDLDDEVAKTSWQVEG